MSNEFHITAEFPGYFSKKDISKVPLGALVSPSKNVIINDREKVSTRLGYVYDDTLASDMTPVESSYEWTNSGGVEIPLKAFDDTLQYRSTAGVWKDLLDGFTSVAFKFATWWDASEAKDLLLFCNGTTSVWQWTGAVATFASATTNTITVQGSLSTAELRFLVGGGSVDIEGTTYAYTGLSGQTLTGVTPDPTSAGHTVGADILDLPVENANIVSSSFDVDIIEVMRNQLWVGSYDYRTIYVSDDADITDFTPASPRVPGDGVSITIDSTPVGFKVQEDSMYVSGSASDWYQSKFTLSADLVNESLEIKKLNTGPLQGAKSQDLIGKIKNSVVFVSEEPTFDTLGRVENIDTPQSRPLSDAIKNDFDNYDFSNGHVLYHRNNSYIALPAESLLIIYDHANGHWQPPQTLPIRRLAVIGGELYFHSSSSSNTYRLFYGTNDDGYGVEAIAAFKYNDYGFPWWKKTFTEWFTVGYVQRNTVISQQLKYEWQGYGQIIEKEIDGNDTAITYLSTEDGSFGKNAFGKFPIGTVLNGETASNKFRCFKTMRPFDFYEIQVRYSTNGIDQQWAILAHGPRLNISGAENAPLKE